MEYDVCVIGGGIVGLATARAVVDRLPGAGVAVLEKEAVVGRHQTGHNSGVLHSGLYYAPGSLKARLCVEGRRRMVEFCEDHQIPVHHSGKVVVAFRPEHLPALDELERRGRQNGLQGLRRLDPGELGEVEPHATGVAALHVPETGVVDYTLVAATLADDLTRSGATVATSSPVVAIHSRSDGTEVVTGSRAIRCRLVVNCAGLHADRVARLAGVEPSLRIVPFRGEYYRLAPEADHLVKALIYPVPDPRFPFLGVHFTRRIDESVEVGPNAVLALAREHYRGRRPNVRDLAEVLGYRGFWKLAARYWRSGAAEVFRSLWRRAYARSARELVPEVRAEHLLTGGAGVRAQAVTPEGKLVDDFALVATDTAVHVLNAPSPAATASLAIGDHIAGLAAERLGTA